MSKEPPASNNPKVIVAFFAETCGACVAFKRNPENEKTLKKWAQDNGYFYVSYTLPTMGSPFPDYIPPAFRASTRPLAWFPSIFMFQGVRGGWNRNTPPGALNNGAVFNGTYKGETERVGRGTKMHRPTPEGLTEWLNEADHYLSSGTGPTSRTVVKQAAQPRRTVVTTRPSTYY